MEGITPRNIKMYDCNICGIEYETPERATDCFERGVDHIELPPGLVLGFHELKRDPLSYLLLTQTTLKPHFSEFDWLNFKEDFERDQYREIPFLPNSSYSLREMLYGDDCNHSVRQLTNDEFMIFSRKTNEFGKAFSQVYKSKLINQHPELDRILKEKN